MWRTQQKMTKLHKTNLSLAISFFSLINKSSNLRLAWSYAFSMWSTYLQEEKYETAKDDLTKKNISFFSISDWRNASAMKSSKTITIAVALYPIC